MEAPGNKSGTSIYFYQGFFYRRDGNERPNGVQYFRCSNYKCSGRATGVMREGVRVITPTAPHPMCHPKDDREITKRKFFAAAKTKAAADFKPLVEIYEECCRE
jgi:hypothetical protein